MGPLSQLETRPFASDITLQASLSAAAVRVVACGRCPRFVHHVDGLRGGAVAPECHRGAMAERRHETCLVLPDLRFGLSMPAHGAPVQLQKADVFTVMFR